MAVAKGKGRITVTLGEPVIERLDELCAVTGFSRSTVVGMIVAQSLVLERPIIELYKSGEGLDLSVSTELDISRMKREGLL